MSASLRTGRSSLGPPSAKLKGAPMGSSGVRMSLNMMAASKPKRRIGCKVTSQAASGVRQSSLKLSLARISWYSGK